METFWNLTYTEPTCENMSYVLEGLHGYCITVQDILANTGLFVVGIIIITLNALVLGILSHDTGHLDPSNRFIIHLATADLLIGVFVLYDVIYNVLQYKVYVECVLRVGMFIALNLASVLTLGNLTMDRYFKIRYPYMYLRKFSDRIVKIGQAFVWLFAFAVGMMPFFGWSTKDILHICDFFAVMDSHFLIFVIVLFTVPFLIMTFAYIRIAVLARNHLKAIKAIEEHSRNVPFTRKTWKATKTASAIVGAFFCCWGPVGLFTVTVIITDIKSGLTPIVSENVIFTYLLGLGIMNSILNPIIYAAKIDVVRKHVNKCCCIRGSGKKHGNVKQRSTQVTML